MVSGETRWSVTSQREDIQVSPTTGQAVTGMLVTFQTAKGAVGSVFVPLSDYSVGKVRTLIAERAATMDGVSDLSG